MQLAYHLLQQGKPPVEVATELGYDYYSTFYHNYIKRFHVPPKSLSSIEYQKFFGKEIDKNEKLITKLKVSRTLTLWLRCDFLFIVFLNF